MNISNCPRPHKILFGQNTSCGITWRGYLTRATILAIGFGGYILLRKKTDLSENGKRFFYAIRKYFPRGKVDENEKDHRECRTRNENEICPVCLGISKTGVRASCGHFLCSKCLTRYCEIRSTNSPPCPLCRRPLNPISSLLQLSDDTEDQLSIASPADLRNSNQSNEFVNQTTHSVFQNPNESDSKPNLVSQTTNLFATCCDGRNYLGRNFILWSLLFVALMVPWCEYIGYGSIFDFLKQLVVMPTIYIWFMYRDRGLSIRRE